MDHDDRMGSVVGVTVAVLIIAALVALALIVGAGVLASVWTVRAERADRVFRADLDETLREILEASTSAEV
jgi:uncharacterized membrane protein YqjE